jgi:hypothetical protein
MKKVILIVSVIIMIFSINSITHADCVDVGSATSWSRIDTHTIIVYRASTPLVLLKMPYCYIYSSSEIRFIKDYICDWDKIIVDGEVCDITKVERL